MAVLENRPKVFEMHRKLMQELTLDEYIGLTEIMTDVVFKMHSKKYKSVKEFLDDMAEDIICERPKEMEK